MWPMCLNGSLLQLLSVSGHAECACLSVHPGPSLRAGSRGLGSQASWFPDPGGVRRSIRWRTEKSAWRFSSLSSSERECIWGAEFQMGTGIICQCEIIHNQACTRPPILPKSPFRPLCRQWEPLPHHLSWSSDGQGSVITQGSLGCALALSPRLPHLVGESSSLSRPGGVLPLLLQLAVRCHRDPHACGTGPPGHTPSSCSQESFFLALRGPVGWGWFAILPKESRCWCELAGYHIRFYTSMRE